MNECKKNQSFGHRIIIGMLLLVAGTLLLLSNLGIVNNEIRYIVFSWPVILIIIGSIVLLNSRDFTGIILICIGSVFLLADYYEFNVWKLWPVLLILVGFKFLLRSRGKNKSSSRNYNDNVGDFKQFKTDYFDDAAVFGGSRKSFISDNFKGGKITALFGGFEIDLSECVISKEKCVIDMTAIFGGMTLYIPRDWKVIINVTPIFGGFNDERRKDPTIKYSEDKVLYLQGLVIFGGGEIKLSDSL